jgi:predicted ATP-grasp superfamily ATP-dependent carboligase
VRARLEQWLTASRARGPIAVLAGNGSVNDLSFARSLGRRGVPTLMLTGRRFLGSYTRHALVIHAPGLAEDPGIWMDLLDVVVSRQAEPAVLFPTSDEHCLWIAQHAHYLNNGFRFVVPDRAIVERIVDKREQYRTAEIAGIETARTLYPESMADVERLADALSYPVILKPYQAHRGREHLSNRKVLVVNSAGELRSAFAGFGGVVSFMIQEIVAGGDDALFAYSGFWDDEGRERAWLTRQKLRQFPPGFGDGSCQRTVDAPEVAELSRRLLRAFGYRGLVGVEFKRDARDGIYRLMEINPRTVSGNQLAVSAGIDLPWIAYRYLIGFRDDAVPSFRTGVQYVNEEWDAQAYWTLRRSGELTLRKWASSLRETRAWALFAADDPLPMIAGLGRVVPALVGRALGSRRGSRLS